MSHYQKLICDLTDEEVSNYASELARQVTEQGEVEAEKKEVMSDFAAKINKIIADTRVLSRKVNTRKEERQVECDYEYDYLRGLVYTVRMDTGVTIGQRKLTDEERQERLDFEGEQDRADETADDASSEVEKQEDPTDDPTEGVTVCLNTACDHFRKDTENGCNQHEHAYECPSAAGELVALEEEQEAQEAQVLTDADKDAICHEWRECEHTEKCFSANDDSCLKDEAAKA